MDDVFFSDPKKVRALVIDNNDKVCAQLRSTLEQTGRFIVRTTTHPREGLELAKAYHPDLVLLEIMMPEMDGTEIAENLHDDQSTRDILLVFVTCLVRNEDLGANYGMICGHPFIPKPVNQVEFLCRLEALLRNRSPVR